MHKVIAVFVVGIFIAGCGGTKPQAGWNASQYFRYAMEKFNDEDYYEASNEFTVVVLRYAGSSVADSAQFYLAESHFYMDEYLIAAVEYEKLINNMSRSPLVPMAQYKLAECYMQLSPRPSLDQKYTYKAIREFQYFVEEYPTHELKEDVEKKISILRSKLAEKKWISADNYRKMREYEASLIYFNLILEKYYDSEWADDAMLGKINTYLDMEDYELARLEVEKFIQQFPSSKLKTEAEKILSKIPNNKEKDHE